MFRKILLVFVIRLLAASAGVAQPGVFPPICTGLKSIDWCHQFPTGYPAAMTVDANGVTYVGACAVRGPCTLSAVAPDGSVIYTAQFNVTITFIAPAGNGSLWVVADEALFQVDGQGREVPLNYNFFGDAPHTFASDAAGNLYFENVPSGVPQIIKMNAAGKVVSTFPINKYGIPVALAVDPAGNVYVVGIPAPSFAATPGAFQKSIPKSHSLVGDAYLLKISPDFDRVVYATLLCQGQCRPPTALTVDGQGSAYIGAEFLSVPDLPPFPVKQLGVPPASSAFSTNVLKINPQGSALLWSDGLGDDSVDSLSALQNGQVRALILMIEQDNEALYTINSASGQIESANFLGRVVLLSPQPSTPGGFLVQPPGGSAATRVLVGLNSARIPVALNDQAETPVVVNFTDPPLQADLSLELTLLQPLVNELVDVRATVTNHGPDDAEGVQVQVGIANTEVEPIECLAGGAAICSVGDDAHVYRWVGAVIPNLRVGQTMNIEFVEYYYCDSPCTPSLNGRVFSLTSDPKLANNFVHLPVTEVTNAFDAALMPPQHLIYYRSDTTDNNTQPGDPPLTADPSLNVRVPVQTFEGNVWYFDSWSDGNRNNPRTFDASNGVSQSKGEMNFHTALPFGLVPGSLDLVVLPGKSPSPQTLRLYPSYRAGVWNIGAPKASWLKLDTVSELPNIAAITATANLAGLKPGYYTTTFSATLEVSGLPDVSVDVPVSLRILAAAPSIAPNGVVNAASYQSGPLSPLEIFNIFGSGLGPPQLVTAFVPEAGSLPTTLAGTSVEINGQPTELLYVQDKVVAAIAPNITYPTPTTVTVKLGGATGASLTIPALPYVPFIPALFTRDSSGTGNVAAANADGIINSPQHPAARGSVVLLYGTGMFEQSNTLSCSFIGNNFGGTFLNTTHPLEAFIGDKPAYVLYSGSAPGLTCGLQQINLLIPDDSATGAAVPVRLGMPFFGGGLPTDPYVWYLTQTGTTIAIQ